MIAFCTIRSEPHYRREAFETGLQRAGYRVVTKGAPSSRSDLLVMWNRQSGAEATADVWERQGGTVIVCENGYLGRDDQGRQFYAIAVHGHNGSGWFPVGDEDRFAKLGVEPKPWVTGGNHILVCGQRGIGSRLMASPRGWEDSTARRLRNMNALPIKLRRHPGKVTPKTTLAEDLAGAAACMIWSSTSGIAALLAGVPVLYAAPHWIAAAGGWHGMEKLERNPIPHPTDEARMAGLQHAAWGQRSIAEIETGEPFVRIRENLGAAKW